MTLFTSEGVPARIYYRMTSVIAYLDLQAGKSSASRLSEQTGLGIWHIFMSDDLGECCETRGEKHIVPSIRYT